MGAESASLLTAQALILSAIGADERVIVTGSSGWFGRTALKLLASTGATILPIASVSKQFQVAGRVWQTQAWDTDEITSFRPTICFDFAYQTRERYDSRNPDEYIKVNSALAEKAMSLVQLPSMKRFIGFSSGAAITDLSHPYGFLKAKYEKDLETLAQSSDASIVCARAWSVSGELVTKRDLFAFSNIVDQATAGRVSIESNSLVFRRFCALDDFLAVVASTPVRSGFRLIDSGGSLVEMMDFAKLVIKQVNPAAILEDHANRGPGENRYHSDNLTWAQACAEVGLREQTLVEQIKIVSSLSEH